MTCCGVRNSWPLDSILYSDKQSADEAPVVLRILWLSDDSVRV